MGAHIKGAEKTCPKCGLPKSLEDFHPSNRRDGRRTYCKLCEDGIREQNVEYMRTYSRAYYDENKEQLSEDAAAYYQAHKPELNAYSKGYYQDRRRNNRAADMLTRTKSRAKKLSIMFDLTLADITIPERCPVLGIPITLESSGRKGPKNQSPSIDRILPEKGYVRGNVRVISHRANTLKCNATVEELEMVLTDLRKLGVEHP